MKLLAEPTATLPCSVYEVTSLADLMRVVEKSRQDMYVTIFRGQRQDLPVIPKVGRLPFADYAEVERRMVSRGARWQVSEKSYGRAWAERRMFDEFCRMAPAYHNTVSEDPWELLAIAQHHGLPTRLLDWTYNPYVAAWFAVSLPPHNSRSNAVIWIHVPDEGDFVEQQERTKSPLVFSRRDSLRPVVFEPRYVTPRIRAQSGLFTIHQLRKRGDFPAIDQEGSHRTCMTKLVIPPRAFLGMRNELDTVAINAASLFPDLDGLTRSLTDSFVEWP